MRKLTGRARENLALAAGFGLSVAALGALWAGAPWRYQLSMGLAFCGLGYALRCKGEAGDRAYFQAMLGAAPLGAVMLLFRDRNDSHLMPALVVASWAAGLAAGTWLAARRTA